MTGPLRCFDIVLNSTGFDAEWYGRSFPDAAMLEMTPAEHYRRFGHRMGRGVSPALPRLADAPDLAAALARRPAISYCIPVMNRGADLRATLARNLEANRPRAEALEFVIVFMDEDRETHRWIRQSFAADLRSGYLRMILTPPLPAWHFGRAKNRHRDHARGAVYSSLDGDNFVTLAETEQLLEIAATHADGFVMHHFTGRWGDGSSGRVSMAMADYRRTGYDETLLPRQFDEMDLMLSVLCARPDIPLIRLRGGDHGFSSPRTRAFMEENAIANPVIEVAPPRRHDPVNPKPADYVQRDALLSAMTDFNQGLSFLKNAAMPSLREKYLALAVTGRHALADALPREAIMPTLFRPPHAPLPEIAPGAVSLFACMKDDDAFLPGFLAHYRGLGVAHFFIVDDGSARPIADTLSGARDVHVFRPAAGHFAAAKGLWIDALMKAALAPGQWALTVDADEFLDLPEGWESLPDLAADLAARGREWMPGLLLDMLPAADRAPEELARAETDYATLFDRHAWIEAPVAPAYAGAKPVQWGFGPWAALSWRIDARYHAFGTLDSLRKMPLIRMRPHTHVNQGFHSLHMTDGSAQPGHEIWECEAILPIRHYKLAKLYSQAARARMAARGGEAGAYHARTGANIARIFGARDGEEPARLLAALPSRAHADSLLTRLDPRDFRAPEPAPGEAEP